MERERGAHIEVSSDGREHREAEAGEDGVEPNLRRGGATRPSRAPRGAARGGNGERQGAHIEVSPDGLEHREAEAGEDGVGMNLRRGTRGRNSAVNGGGGRQTRATRQGGGKSAVGGCNRAGTGQEFWKMEDLRGRRKLTSVRGLTPRARGTDAERERGKLRRARTSILPVTF